MGRWRPPPPASSPYITPQGYEALQSELDEIWVRRRDVVKALAAAAAEGDRSENAEYIYRKKELGGLDRRIHYLQKRMPTLNVVRESPTSGKAFFGAYVQLRSCTQCSEDDGEFITYRIVGPDETNTSNNQISMDSPLSKAMLGKQAGDMVTIATENKTSTMEIVSVKYQVDSTA